MEHRFFEASLVKEKFALLISKLHRADLLADYINDRMIYSSFFDCFEKNDLEDFMSLSFESITKEVFKKEVIYDYSLNYIDAYYWAGLNIMNIMMNLEIPLKRILTIMPLKEIVGAYTIYHEMHPEQFLHHYAELENERSLLKLLRNEAGLSIAEISFLTGIKTTLLRVLDYSNAALFSTSFSNLTKLSVLFHQSIDVFKKKSTFVAFSESVLRSKTFEPILIHNILAYHGMEDGINFTVIYEYLDDKKCRALLKDYKVIVDLFDPYGVIYIVSNRIFKKYFSAEEFAFIYKASIERLRYQIDDIVF